MSIQQALILINPYIVATGGTVTTDGDYRVHTFTSSGSFIVSNAPSGKNCDILLVAGGGGAADRHAGGGGAE